MKKDNFVDDKPAFSSELLPRYVFIMRTKKDLQGFKDKLMTSLKKDLPFAVPLDKLEALLDKRLKDAPDLEVHGAAVAEDSNNHAQTYLTEYRTYNGVMITDGNGHTSSRIKTCEGGHTECVEDLDNQLAQAEFNATQLQYRTDWGGERELPAFEWTGDSLESLKTELEAKGYMEDFKHLYPNTVLDAAPQEPTPSVIKRYTPETRKALVRRFGEDKVKELENRVKDKGIQL